MQPHTCSHENANDGDDKLHFLRQPKTWLTQMETYTSKRALTDGQNQMWITFSVQKIRENAKIQQIDHQ